MKKVLITLGVIVVVILVVLAILPLLINANSFKPRVQDELTKALGRPVTIGDLSASIYSGGITAKNITIADDPAFEPQPFIQAQAIKIGVDMGALIFSRKVKIQSLNLQSPDVHLLQNQAGRWNFASLGGQKSANPSKPGTQTSTGDEVSADKIAIEDGRITVGQIGQPQRTYTDVALTAKNLSYVTAFPFTVTAKTPGNGSLKLDGQAGPINQQDASATPLEAKVTINNLDLGKTGFTDPNAGIGGTADFSGTLKSDGSNVQTHGDVTVKNGKFAAAAQPSSVPIGVHYVANYSIPKQTADITTGTISIGKAAAQLTGTLDNRPTSPVLNMKLVGNGMPVESLEGALPGFGVILPPSAKLENGTANANFQITGPMNNTVIVGNAALNNAKLANFDLGSKMKVIGPLAGISSSQDTVIQTFSANLKNTKAGSDISNLNLVIPTIGTITGQGTVSANNALDFHLLVKLSGNSPAGLLTSVAGGVAGGANSNGIPVSVKGTTQNPQFIPDVGGLVKNVNPLQGVQGKTPGNVGGLVQGLFGKKKSK
jgi:AsmA protein